MSDIAAIPKFDFSDWAQLAQDDPRAFEKRRQQTIETAINAMADHRQHRMHCLQWRIDQERNLAHSPMAACIKISRMMWDNVLGEHGLLESLRSIENGNAIALQPANANILAFPSAN